MLFLGLISWKGASCFKGEGRGGYFLDEGGALFLSGCVCVRVCVCVDARPMGRASVLMGGFKKTVG